MVPTDNAKELLNPLNERGLSKIMNIIWFPVWKKAIDSTNGRWPHWVTVGNAIRSLYDYFDGEVHITNAPKKNEWVNKVKVIYFKICCNFCKLSQS